MKKAILVLAIVAMLVALPSCAKKEAPQTAVVEKSPWNFDIEQYGDHGALSCGLIWVEKTESSYDTAPTTTFAYLDKDGNVKSPWFDSKLYTKANFMNNMLVLQQSPYTEEGGSRDYATCIVYDTEFNVLWEGNAKTVTGEDGHTRSIAIANPNSRGEVFAFANVDGDKLDLIMVTKDGLVKFPVAESAFTYKTVANLENIALEGDYYIIDFRSTVGNSPCYMGVFDLEGNLIFEPSEVVEYVVYSVNVKGENEFEITFKGKDWKDYSVTTDNTGAFLTKPELK